MLGFHEPHTGRPNGRLAAHPYRALLAALTFMALSGCGGQPGAQYTPSISSNSANAGPAEYIFGVHPLHNPARLHETFGPMMDYLNAHIEGATFRLEASRNYAAYDEKLYRGHFHFSLPNPYQTINSLRHDYRVFGKMGDDHNFRGIILVRRDSGIEKPSDLKGKAVSYPAPTALAATMMPQHYLQTHGLDVMRDIDNRYVGSQESSVMNVFLGNTAAGATWPPPWRALAKQRPELARQLEVKWQTEALPNNGLVVRNDVPREVVKQVSAVLFSLHTHEEGRRILARMELSRFAAASDETYKPVVKFVETFRTTVRPTE